MLGRLHQAYLRRRSAVKGAGARLRCARDAAATAEALAGA